MPRRRQSILLRMIAGHLPDAARWSGQRSYAAGLEDGSIDAAALPSGSLGPEVPVPADVPAMLVRAYARWEGLARLGSTRRTRADFAYEAVRDEIGQAFDALEAARARYRWQPPREVHVDFVETSGEGPSHGGKDDEELSGGSFDEQFSAWSYDEGADRFDEGNAPLATARREGPDLIWDDLLALQARDELLLLPSPGAREVRAARRSAGETGIDRLLARLRDPSEAAAFFALHVAELNEQELEALESRGFAALERAWPTELAWPSEATIEALWQRRGPRAPYCLDETPRYDRRRVPPRDRHLLARAGFVLSARATPRAVARPAPRVLSDARTSTPPGVRTGASRSRRAAALGERWRWAQFLERCAEETLLSDEELELLRYRQRVALATRARLAGVSVPTMHRREQAVLERARAVWREVHPGAPLPDALLRRHRHAPEEAA